MKVTLIRTDNKNVPHVTVNTIEKLMTRMQTDTKQQTVQSLRRHLPMLVSLGWHFKDMHLLPRIYPAVELTKTSNGDLTFKNWNGLVLLTIGGVDDREKAEQVKAAAMGLPSTLAAFRGSSGKTVKLLVRVVAANGQEPNTEEEADVLYRGHQPDGCADGSIRWASFPWYRVDGPHRCIMPSWIITSPTSSTRNRHRRSLSQIAAISSGHLLNSISTTVLKWQEMSMKASS